MHTDESQAEPVPRYAWWLLAALAVVAALLRFYELGKESFWFDELCSLDFSARPPVEVLRVLARDVHPPAYFLMLHALMGVLGDSEWALRLPSAVFGTALVALVFVVGRATYTWREGLIAAALTAVLWYPLSSSRDARPYAMLMCCAAGSSWLFLKLLREARDRERWPWAWTAAYAASAALGLYTHYFAGLLVAVHAFYGLGYFLGQRRKQALVLLTFVLVTIAYLPWLPVVYDRFLHGGGHAFWKAPEWDDLPGFFWFSFNLSPAITWSVLALLAALAVAEGRTYLRTSAASRPALLRSSGYLLALWALGPLVLVFLVSFKVHIFNYRYFAFAVPAVYLLAARALCRLPQAWNRRLWLPGAAVLLLALHTWLGLRFFDRPWKSQYREAVVYVAEHEPDPNGVVVGYIFGADGRHYNYYFEKAGSPLRVRFSGLNDLPALRAFLASPPPRLWFILTNGSPNPEQVACLSEHMVATQRIRFFEAEVWLFEPRAP